MTSTMDESVVIELIDRTGLQDHREQSLVLYENEPYRVLEFQEEGLALTHLYHDMLVSNRFVPYEKALTAYENGDLTRATVTELPEEK